MTTDGLSVLFVLAAINVLVMVICLRAFNAKRIAEETARKAIHIALISSAGIASLTFHNRPVLIALTVVGTWAAFLFIKSSLWQKLGFRRTGDGILYFLFAYLILLLLFVNNWIIFISMMVLGLADGLAAIVGIAFPIKKWPIQKSTKSVGGSFMFFITSLLLVLAFWLIPAGEGW